jgi:hypothetical protein
MQKDSPLSVFGWGINIGRHIPCKLGLRGNGELAEKLVKAERKNCGAHCFHLNQQECHVSLLFPHTLACVVTSSIRVHFRAAS